MRGIMLILISDWLGSVGGFVACFGVLWQVRSGWVSFLWCGCVELCGYSRGLSIGSVEEGVGYVSDFLFVCCV